MLSKLVVNKGRDWDQVLGPFLFAYPLATHHSIHNVSMIVSQISATCGINLVCKHTVQYYI